MQDTINKTPTRNEPRDNAKDKRDANDHEVPAMVAMGMLGLDEADEKDDSDGDEVPAGAYDRR
ncbi:MAG: hypothetical protein ABI178_03945 [Rhodanobacter sp.]